MILGSSFYSNRLHSVEGLLLRHLIGSSDEPNIYTWFARTRNKNPHRGVDIRNESNDKEGEEGNDVLVLIKILLYSLNH